MKKGLYKVLSLFLAITVLFASMPSNIAVWAEEVATSGKCGLDATWNLDTDTQILTISGSGDIYDNPGLPKEIKKVVINEGITGIGTTAFYMSEVEEVSLPSSLKTIGRWAFWGCQNIQSLYLPENLESLGESVFEKCTALTEFTVDEDNQYFTSVDGCLYNKECTEIILFPVSKNQKTFDIPNSVKKIGTYAFTYNEYLQELTIPASVKSLDEKQSFGFSKSFTNIAVDNDNKYYSSVDGNLYNKDQTKLIKYAIAKEETVFVIPESVNSVASRAFQNAALLEDVTISSGVTEIGSKAFNNCATLKIVRVINPECSLEDIFDSDSIKSNFTLHASKPSGAAEFSGKYNVAFVEVPEGEVSSISVAEMPRKTKFALGSSFANTGLTINVNYEDGTSIKRTTGFTVEGFDSSALGACTLTVNYKEATASFDIEIVEEVENEVITSAGTTIVDILEGGEVRYLEFTPAVAGTYEFYSDSNSDTVGYLYDIDKNLIASGDDEKGVDFYISCELEANVTYVIAVKYSSSNETGNFKLVVTAPEQETTTPEQTTPETTTPEQITPEPVTPETTTPEPTTPEPTTPSVTETTTQEPVSTSRVETTKAVEKVTAPAKTKIKKVNTKKKAAKKIKLSLKKINGADGYQVAVYKTKKNAKKDKKAIVKKFVKKTKITVKSKKLKGQKKLFVKARAFVLDADRNKVYGKWSKVKKVKIKK